MTNKELLADAAFDFIEGMQHNDIDIGESHTFDSIVVGAIITEKDTGTPSTLLLIRDKDGNAAPRFVERGIMETLAEAVR